MAQIWVNSDLVAKCELKTLHLYVRHVVTSWGARAYWEISSWHLLVVHLGPGRLFLPRSPSLPSPSTRYPHPTVYSRGSLSLLALSHLW